MSKVAVLYKSELINDINVYTVHLTEQQAELFEKDRDAFWQQHENSLDWEFQYAQIGDPMDLVDLRWEEPTEEPDED